MAKDTLALIGNTSCYISQLRRTQYINSVNTQHPAVARFLHDTTKEGNCGKGPDLFDPDVHKMVTDSADTIGAFNKAVNKVEAALTSVPPSIIFCTSARPCTGAGQAATTFCKEQCQTVGDHRNHESAATKENSPPKPSGGNVHPVCSCNTSTFFSIFFRPIVQCTRKFSHSSSYLEGHHRQPLGSTGSPGILHRIPISTPRQNTLALTAEQDWALSSKFTNRFSNRPLHQFQYRTASPAQYL